MPEILIRRRLMITTMLLAIGTVLLHAVTTPPKIPARRLLKEIPLMLGGWHGAEVPISDRLVEAAGTDDYLNRIYRDDAGNRIDAYIGYYNSQHSGRLPHSPRNCLPAAGWEWVRTGRLAVVVPGRPPLVINDFQISKGLQRELVLYWYQGRGRVIADEFQAKLWTIVDAAKRRRSDGSLVRLMMPITSDEQEARTTGLRFLALMVPLLSSYIPD